MGPPLILVASDQWKPPYQRGRSSLGRKGLRPPETRRVAPRVGGGGGRPPPVSGMMKGVALIPKARVASAPRQDLPFLVNSLCHFLPSWQDSSRRLGEGSAGRPCLAAP